MFNGHKISLNCHMFLHNSAKATYFTAMHLMYNVFSMHFRLKWFLKYCALILCDKKTKAHYLFITQPSTHIIPSQSVVATITEEPVVAEKNTKLNCHNILSLGENENDHHHNLSNKLPSDTVITGQEKTQGENHI